VTAGAGPDEISSLLAEQVVYYRARAPEYELGALPGAWGGEPEAALEAFSPAGEVLELACGMGAWTRRLLARADSVTALDASSEMLAVASSRIRDERVTFVQADVFGWEADRRYDVVFFGFWLSHVPLERFEAFWSRVERWTAPGGRVFFVDDAYRTPDELIYGEDSSIVQRRLSDGSTHRIVKVPHRPHELEARLRGLGWAITVSASERGPFYWGAGGRA
jgi:demethylmenaquinone methyltransferase/2-methoxy-6-polyprenyl-1,4-benzoquinol methylase